MLFDYMLAVMLFTSPGLIRVRLNSFNAKIWSP